MKPKLTNIHFILGVFHSDYWDVVKKATKSFDYFDLDRGKLPVRPRWIGNIGLDMIKPLTPIVEQFNFLLDNLYLPLNPKESVTCKELDYILNNPDSLAKTQFWLKGEKVAKDKVLQVISTVKQDKLVFENLDLNTF